MPEERPVHAGNNLDFLRLLFAVLVVFSHAYALHAGGTGAEPLARLTGGCFTGGDVAVAFFFIASGYLITASWARRPAVAGYLRRRCLRILPGYAVAVAVSIGIVAPLAGGHRGVPWAGLARQAVVMDPLVAPAAFAANPFPRVINGSLWTIRYEAYCYLAVAVLGVCGVIRRRRWAAAVFGASLLVGPLAGRWPSAAVEGLGTPQAWGRLGPYFLAGVVARLYHDVIPRRPWLFAAAALGIWFTVALGPACAGLAYATAAVGGAYAVLYVGFHPRLPFHGFGRFGDFSYGTYLYAFPVQQLLVMRWPALSALRLFAAAAPLSVLAGVLSWHGVERHFVGGGRAARPLTRRPW